MNQTPAAILVLAASVSGHAACAAGSEPLRMANGLAAISLALWGALSLVRWQRQPRRSAAADPKQAHDVRRGPLDLARLDDRVGQPLPHGTSKLAPGQPADHRLSPEINAQLSLVAHVQGREPAQIMEDLLTRHLPRYTNSGCA